MLVPSEELGMQAAQTEDANHVAGEHAQRNESRVQRAGRSVTELVQSQFCQPRSDASLWVTPLAEQEHKQEN